MSIAPECELELSAECEGELQRYGALLFGPPDTEGMTRKLHVCVSCYEIIENMRLGFQPDWRVHPGETLRECLTQSEMTPEEFVRQTGISAEWLDAYLEKNPTRAISDTIARQLAAVFGTSAEFWLNLEAEYRRPPGIRWTAPPS